MIGAFCLVASTRPLLAFDLAQPEPEPKLRPPRAEIPPGFWDQYGAWVIAAAVLFLGLMAVLVWFLRRPKPPLMVPPAVQAREALEPLRRQPEDGALLSRVSQVLRHYVASAFGLPAIEQTTAEFTQALAGQEQVGPQLASAVTSFLRQCDARKFAPASSLPPPLPGLNRPGTVGQALRLIEQAEARRALLAPAPTTTSTKGVQ